MEELIRIVEDFSETILRKEAEMEVLLLELEKYRGEYSDDNEYIKTMEMAERTKISIEASKELLAKAKALLEVGDGCG